MLGFIGGSGLYELLESAQNYKISTPYGDPVSHIVVGKLGGQEVVFLSRHGMKHEFPPHKVPYRANIWAMKEAGVDRIIAACAAGSLRIEIKPGDFVIIDQFVDRTWGREVTYFEGPEVIHTAMADPYCIGLRDIIDRGCKELSLPYHNGGTIVVIQGPRFSTRAESRSYQEAGYSVINMTQCPEAVLARELKICYGAVALSTDYDVGVQTDPTVKPVTHEEVLRVFEENINKVKQLFSKIAQLPQEKDLCKCNI